MKAVYDEIVKAKKGGRYLIGSNVGGYKKPIFCTSGTLWYFEMIQEMGNEQPIYCFEPTKYETLEEIVPIYLLEMQSVQPYGPYTIVGYCQSGYIALEMTAALEQQGILGNNVILIESYAPNFEEEVEKRFRIKLFVDRIGEAFIVRPARYAAKLGNKTNRERAKLVVNKVKRLAGRYLSKKENLSRTAATMPQPNEVVFFKNPMFHPISGIVKIINASTAHPYSRYDPKNGWGTVLGNCLELHVIEGAHATIFKKPHVKFLAEKILQLL
jgi:thioesterase domain-containing protein